MVTTNDNNPPTNVVAFKTNKEDIHANVFIKDNMVGISINGETGYFVPEAIVKMCAALVCAVQIILERK